MTAVLRIGDLAPAQKWPRVLGCAMRYARLAVEHSKHPAALDGWTEDIAHDVALRVFELSLIGRRVGRRMYWKLALDALSRLMGRALWRLATEDEPADVVSEPEVSEAKTIALWRLQRAWPTLTTLQREAVSALVTGETETELIARLGGEMGTYGAARRHALKILNDPEALASRKPVARERFGEKQRRARKPPPPRPCRWCGREFQPKQPRALMCGVECLRAAQRDGGTQRFAGKPRAITKGKP